MKTLWLRAISFCFLQDLLNRTGATVVQTINDLAAERQKLKILVVQADQWDDKILSKSEKSSILQILVHN